MATIFLGGFWGVTATFVVVGAMFIAYVATRRNPDNDLHK